MRNQKQHAEAKERVQKVLAQAGVGSRRAIEELIRQGRVTVNGKPAVLGMKAGLHDHISVDKRVIKLNFDTELPRVILYYKPEGEIVSRADPEGRPSVFDKLPVIRSAKWIAIGRLDYNTLGLLMFTNSGELANRLMHPKYEVEREYAVRILGRLKPEQMLQLGKGVWLEDGLAKVESINDQGGVGANHWYRIVLKEGRNRVVHRIFKALGFTVSRLIRVRFGMIWLPPRLKKGQCLELGRNEITKIMAQAESPAPRKIKQDCA
ncbi:MAG TPA: pseudouridine synthase [Burkholderiales bacterium]|nr:pseudouridine synthase [Burkholderiales bacterium]